jgi:hypothetical protein
LFLPAPLVGITGTLLNTRTILVVYVRLLFPSFLSSSVSYLTYKKANFSLDSKSAKLGTPGILLAHGLNFKWHSTVVDGVVHFTVRQWQVYITLVLYLLAAMALLCIPNVMSFSSPRVQYFLWFRSIRRIFLSTCFVPTT